MGADSNRAAAHLKRLIEKKNLVEYEQRRLIRSEAVELADHARRSLKWARTQLPGS